MTTQLNQFAGEEVHSLVTYPDDYKGPKPIELQIAEIAEIFHLEPKPALEFAKNLPALPEGAEGWFAIPYWAKVANTYREALLKVLTAIASRRKFDYGMPKKGKHLGQRFCADQKEHDILAVPAQFGLRHRGRSARRAREVFASNELSLGAFAVGCMLLTHPERAAGGFGHLHVYCPADEIPPEPIGGLPCVSTFNCFDELEFTSYWIGRTCGGYWGSASAFRYAADASQ